MSLLRDVKYAVREFRRNRAFTVTALAVLAIGIGANTAIFSVVNTMLLKPLAMPEPGRVVQLMRRNQRFNLYCIGVSDLMVWQAQTRILGDVAAYSYVPDSLTLAGDDAPEPISAEHVSREYFQLFGAHAVLGRTFTAQEDRPQAGNFVVLSHGLWQRRFGSDPNIIGKTILLGKEAYAVVGVLSSGFQGDRSVDLWLPLQPDLASKEGCSLWGAGRLRPGVTLDQATAVLRAAAAQYKRTYPLKTSFLGEAAMPDEVTYAAEPMERIVTGDVRTPLLILLAAVGCVLLIACSNVANLLLVRAAGRNREIAIRAALGAARGAIIRQLLTESLLLSLAGGALGLVLGAFVIRALPALEPMNIARIGPSPKLITLDGRALAVTLALSLLTGILFGLVPALHGSRVDLSRRLKTGGPASNFVPHRFRTFLITAEVALSVMLLAAAGLMLRSFLALSREATGFDPQNVVVLETPISGRPFDRVAGISEMVRNVEEGLLAIPGIEAVSAEDSVPLLPNLGRAFVVDGQLGGSRWRAVTPGYFSVFRIPLVEGRGFHPSDDAHAPPVVVINQTMARRYWPNQDPLGKHFSFLGPAGSREASAEVVGVVADVREVDLRNPIEPVVYVPLDQVDDRFFASMRIWLQSLSWTIRTRVAPAGLFPAIRREFRNAAGLPIGHFRPMTQISAASTSHDESQAVLLGTFALIAILLAALGLHGVLAYSVQQRTQEFGIRLALGAAPSDLRRLVVRQGAIYTAAGIFIGLTGALALTRLMRGLLFGVRPNDPVVFAAAPVLLALVGLMASYLPSRRATAIDPAAAMRYE